MVEAEKNQQGRVEVRVAQVQTLGVVTVVVMEVKVQDGEATSRERSVVQ